MSEELSDPQGGELRKANGMERVAEGAVDWLARGLAAVSRLARRQRVFSADDVWFALGEDRPKEPRAMGPVLQAAAKAGLIRQAGVVKSERASRSRGYVTRWESLILQGRVEPEPCTPSPPS
jgi:hypothetical protein